MKTIERWVVSCALAALTLHGCAAPPNIKAYTGAALPAERVALIKNNPMIGEITDTGAVLKSLDGKPLSRVAPAVEVLPGLHNAQVECSVRVERFLLGERLSRGELHGKIVKFETVGMDLHAEPGRVYRLDAQLQDNERCRITLSDITGLR